MACFLHIFIFLTLKFSLFMKINGNANYFSAGQRLQAATAKPFSIPFQAETTVSAKHNKIDFANMTNQEMRDWVNGEIHNGKMTLDEGFPLFAMTLEIPVNGQSNERDGMRHDFMKKARDGIIAARSNNDKTAIKMLDSAIAIMQRY